jgi:hypothetical protein
VWQANAVWGEKLVIHNVDYIHTWNNSDSKVLSNLAHLHIHLYIPHLKQEPDTFSNMATKPTYSEAQLETYLKRIGYSKSAGSETRLLQHVRQNIEKDAHATLCDLQRRHLTAIPWGNSELHYSRHHTISLDPESLFEKMVERRLDGYCMENTGLFLLILRSLGYSVYPTAGRVAQAAETGVDTGLFFSM